MVALSYIVIGFTLVRLLVALANLAGRQWLRDRATSGEPFVSVLIPARDEEKNIGNILNDLIIHDYKNLEIIVYDDLSTDNTHTIALDFAEKDTRVKVIKGEKLPHGWLGKNHGCFQLASHASGEYLLFLDADVSVGNGLIKNGVAAIENYRVDLLSIFPRQEMNSLAEWLIVPIMNWILVSLLPLALVRRSSWVSFSAANGQFMLFRGEVYRKEQFHSALRNKNVEDIEISQLMKRKGYRVQTILGNYQIRCRMYHSFNEAVKGISRSVFSFFGGNIAVAFLFGLITTFGIVPVILTSSSTLVFFYLGIVIILRVSVSLASRQNIIANLFLAPFQQIVLLYVLAVAFAGRLTRSTQWKGRNISKI